MSRSPSPSRSTASRAVHAGHVGERVLDERIRARVLEPLDAVIRLDDRLVERVAVRQQDVEVAVAVEVHHLDARRAPVRMRGRCRSPSARSVKSRVPLVDEGDHLLELLREQRDEVHLAVPVQIDREWRGSLPVRGSIDVARERRLA